MRNKRSNTASLLNTPFIKYEFEYYEMRENILVSNDPFIIEWAEKYKGLEAKKVRDTNVRSLISSQEARETNPRLTKKSLFNFKKKLNYKDTDHKLVQSSFINEILTCNQCSHILTLQSGQT